MGPREVEERVTRCPHCRQQVRPAAKYCSHCGGALPAITPHPYVDSAPVCPSCGAAARPGARFCRQCGTSLSAATPATTPEVKAPDVPPQPVLSPPVPVDEGPIARRQVGARLRLLIVTAFVIAALLLGILLLRPDDTPVTPAVPTPNIAATLTVNAVTPTAPGSTALVDN